VNPLYPALKRLPFSGFQSSLIADRRGGAIRPAIETLQKANRSCGRARTATSTADRGFAGYLPGYQDLFNYFTICVDTQVREALELNVSFGLDRVKGKKL